MAPKCRLKSINWQAVEKTVTRGKTATAGDGSVTTPRVENDTLPLAHDPDLEFRPIKIQGEPLSATIIRERR